MAAFVECTGPQLTLPHLCWIPLFFSLSIMLLSFRLTRAQDARETSAPTMTLMLGDAADALLQRVTASRELAAARFSRADAQRVQNGTHSETVCACVCARMGHKCRMRDGAVPYCVSNSFS